MTSRRRRLRRLLEATEWPSEMRLRTILFAGLRGDLRAASVTTLWRCHRAIPEIRRPLWFQTLDRAERRSVPGAYREGSAWLVSLNPRTIALRGVRAAHAEAFWKPW